MQMCIYTEMFQFWTPGRFWGVGFDPHVGNHFKGQQPKINQKGFAIDLGSLEMDSWVFPNVL